MSWRSTKLLQKMSRLKTVNKPGSACIVTDTRSNLREKTWKLVGDSLKSNGDIDNDNPRSNDDNLRFNNNMLAINLDPTAYTSVIWQQGYVMTYYNRLDTLWGIHEMVNDF